MRLFMRCAMAGLLCSLGACSGGGGEEEGMVLKVGNGAEVQNLDPHLVTGVPEHRVLSALFEGLVDLDPETMAPVPAVAASWAVSPDRLVYTFSLRPEAKWSTGDPMTAQDFVYSWRRMLSPNLAAEYAYMLHCVKNAKDYNDGVLDDFEQVGVKALDPRTLEVTLGHPTPYFLSMHTHCAWYPVHGPAIAQHGAMDERDTRWTRAGNHVGNGAFRLAVWSPNEVIRVVRNEHYWDAAKMRLDAVEFYPISNHQTEERSFRADELHITSTVPMYKLEVYGREQRDLLNLTPYLGTYFYRMNVTKPPFDDKRVRQAFSMSIDREELADNVLKGGELPAYSFTPPDTAGYTSTAMVQYDVKRARELLAEAGYPNGAGLPPIEILYNTSDAHKTIAETIQRMWKESLNADVQLLNQDWKVYLSSMDMLDYAVARSAWIGDVVDAVNFLECFLTDGGNNRTGWSSPAFDALIERAYAEPETAERIKVMQEAEALLLDEAPIAPIYFYTWKFLKAREVKGLVPNILGYVRWRDLYLEAAKG